MWGFLTAAIICEVTGTLLLRKSEGLRDRRLLLPFLFLQGAAFACLFWSLEAGMTIGVAYGIWAAVGVALTAVAARLFFNEQLTRRMGVGIAVIAVGVLLIELGGVHPAGA
jgi:small multidrug resistance pump